MFKALNFASSYGNETLFSLARILFDWDYDVAISKLPNAGRGRGRQNYRDNLKILLDELFSE